MTSNTQHPFDALSPDFIMDAVESLGHHCDCRTYALNSYENRVYQVGVEDQPPLIVKFYRPDRWTDLQIQEEHDFCFELAEHELPVVVPLVDRKGHSLHRYGDFLFALYPRQGGHAPEFDNLDNLLTMGRMIGRMHAIGATRSFSHRPALTLASYGEESASLILNRFIPEDLKDVYRTLTDDLLNTLRQVFQDFGELTSIRTHCDCHSGNVLWRDDNPHFVDFDDARMAPAIQDLWMMLSGDRHRQRLQIAELVEGYDEFYGFSPRELVLIEPLRTLRMLHYSAWLANRWDDPAFPAHFPWFNSPQYWGEHILELREQYAILHEPPLEMP